MLRVNSIWGDILCSTDEYGPFFPGAASWYNQPNPWPALPT
jgi:hypothetical protein